MNTCEERDRQKPIQTWQYKGMKGGACEEGERQKPIQTWQYKEMRRL